MFLPFSFYKCHVLANFDTMSLSYLHPHLHLNSSACVLRQFCILDLQKMPTPKSGPVKALGRGSAARIGNLVEADVPAEVKVTQTVKEPERNFEGTPYISIYVMLPLDVINNQNLIANSRQLEHDLQGLKSLQVDGVMLDVWWGLVEKEGPQKYNWTAYDALFRLIRSAELKLQVVMSFHQCGGNIGDDVNIPLPKWILDIGLEDQDIFFVDKQGTRNSECLSWGIDKECVLKGRTALEVYFDFMKSFREAFDEFFKDGTIEEIEVGLGPCGELRYPSYPLKFGWNFPGIGEFQCYDKYLMCKLKEAAMSQGHPEWGTGPINAGNYNSQPHGTDFFRVGGDYDSYYGRFFLRWYSEILINHGDAVLALAKRAFGETRISAKVSGIHWCYKSLSHAAEATAGFYNTSQRNGYAPIAQMFAKHKTTLNFTCVEFRTIDFDKNCPEALSDPEGLVWQVLNTGWDAGLHVASENALPCNERAGYNKILENAKPRKDADGRHICAFTYLRLTPALMETDHVSEFARFVNCLHGRSNTNGNGMGSTCRVQSGSTTEIFQPLVKPH